MCVFLKHLYLDFIENAGEKDRKDLLNELQIMVTVGEHPNIISLIGACTKSGSYLLNE